MAKAKGLHNLIRLHEWTVDERRRELGTHLREREEMDRARDLMDQELQREQALAAANPDGLGVTFGAYYNLYRYRRDRLELVMRKKDEEILEARDILSRAYMDLKKYQVAQEVRDREAAEEAARKEQEVLDEIGLQLYRRQNQKKRA